MDPTSTVQQRPSAPVEDEQPQTEIWMPAFERWQRITEALISGADRVTDLTKMPRSHRM